MFATVMRNVTSSSKCARRPGIDFEHAPGAAIDHNRNVERRDNPMVPQHVRNAELVVVRKVLIITGLAVCIARPAGEALSMAKASLPITPLFQPTPAAISTSPRCGPMWNVDAMTCHETYSRRWRSGTSASRSKCSKPAALRARLSSNGGLLDAADLGGQLAQCRRVTIQKLLATIASNKTQVDVVHLRQLGVCMFSRRRYLSVSQVNCLRD